MSQSCELQPMRGNNIVRRYVDLGVVRCRRNGTDVLVIDSQPHPFSTACAVSLEFFITSGVTCHYPRRSLERVGLGALERAGIGAAGRVFVWLRRCGAANSAATDSTTVT